MARLFTWHEIDKNGTLYPSPITKLLNAKNVVSIRQVRDTSIFSAPSGVSLLDYRVNDNAMPDMRYSTDAASVVNTQINVANTSNNIESILLNITAQPASNLVAYKKYFNPRYIYEVGDSVNGIGHSYVMYEEPQAQDAVITTYIVDETQAQIKAAADA